MDSNSAGSASSHTTDVPSPEQTKRVKPASESLPRRVRKSESGRQTKDDKVEGRHFHAAGAIASGKGTLSEEVGEIFARRDDRPQ